MRNFLFTSIISIFLAACGSGSESDIDHEQLARFKGLEQSPEVDALSSSDSGGFIDLNQSISGEITGSETASFSYTPSYSGYVSIQFYSPSEDVQFNIEEDGVLSYPLSLWRDNSSVQYLGAGKVYTFEVDQYFIDEDGFTLIEKPDEVGEFEISLAESNRQSLQLTENEFLLELNYSGSAIEQGRPDNAGYYPEQAGPEDYQALLIINFLDGYKSGRYLDSNDEYAQVSGATFEFRTEAGIEMQGTNKFTALIPETRETVVLDVSDGSISGSYRHEHDIGLFQEIVSFILGAETMCDYFESMSLIPPEDSECAELEKLNSGEAELIYSDLKTDWLRVSDGNISGKIIL